MILISSNSLMTLLADFDIIEINDSMITSTFTYLLTLFIPIGWDARDLNPIQFATFPIRHRSTQDRRGIEPLSHISRQCPDSNWRPFQIKRIDNLVVVKGYFSGSLDINYLTQCHSAWLHWQRLEVESNYPTCYSTYMVGIILYFTNYSRTREPSSRQLSRYAFRRPGYIQF